MERGGVRRVVGIEPITRGFGWAVVEGRERLVDWGVVTTPGAEVRRFKTLLRQYLPDTVAFPELDESRGDQHASAVIETLSDCAGPTKSVIVSRESVELEFRGSGATTRREITRAVANQFPFLGPVQNPKRSWWKKDGERIATLSAIALAVTVAA